MPSRLAEEDTHAPPAQRPRISLSEAESSVPEVASGAVAAAQGSVVAVLDGPAANPPSAQRPRMSISEADLDTIVQRVTSAVMNQLQPSTPQQPQTASSSVTEVASGAAAAVQGSVVAVLDGLSGESVSDSPRPYSVFTASDLPIGLAVPAKIKAKILANEYIDFGCLITNYNKAGVGYRLGVSDAASNQGAAALTFEPNIKVKQITSIETWTTAFQVFVAIYTAQHTSESPALMKYGETIRDLASRGFNWRYYDENYRFLRQDKPAAYPWNSLHSELWIRSQPSLNFRQPPANFRASNNKLHSGSQIQERKLDIPKGFCYTYHLGKLCTGCSFKHACPRCSNKHPLLKCNFRPSRDNQPSTNAANASNAANAANASTNAAKASNANRAR